MKTTISTLVLTLLMSITLFAQSNCSDPFVTIAPDPAVPFSDCCLFVDIDNGVANQIIFIKLENPNGFDFANVQAFNGWTINNVTSTSAEIYPNSTYLPTGFFADYIRFCMVNITSFPQDLDISFYEEDMNGNPILLCAQTRNMDCPMGPPPCMLSSQMDDVLFICEGMSVPLAPIIVGGAGLQYTWSPSAGLSSSTVANPIASPIVTTLYTLNVIDGLGCTLTDSVWVEVSNPNLHLVDSISLCSWDDTTINATFSGGIGNIIYDWTPGSGLSDSTILNPVVSANDQVYQLQVTDGLGCTDEESVVVVTEDCCTIEVAIKDTITICEGDNQLLHLGVSGEMGTVTYSWSPGISLNDSTLANPTASPTMTTVYVLTATDAQGCMDSEQLVVIVEDCCVIEVDLPDTLQVCLNDSIQVVPNVSNSQGVIAYNWMPANIVSNPFAPDPYVTPTSSTNLIVTVEDNTRCTASDTVFIEVEYCCDLEVFVTGMTNLCIGESSQLGAQITGGYGNITFDWSSTQSIGDSTIQNPIINPLASADYVLTIIDSLGCTASDTLSVNVMDCCDLSLDYFTQHNICANGLATLGGSAQTSNGPMTYLWQPSTGLSDSTASNPTASVDATVTYTLTITDALGCVVTEQVSVKVEDCPCDNLIVDGDFENPNMTIANGLTDSCICISNSYCITDQAHNKCPNTQWQNIVAPSGTGNYMVIDAPNGSVVWESSVAVIANQDYYFCFDYYPNISLGGLPVLTIDLYDGANLISNLGSTNGISGSWSNYCAPAWQSAVAGNYTLRITHTAYALYSDYGIDNLSFSCDPLSSVIDNNSNDINLKVFPNPFTNEINVTFKSPSAEIYSYYIYNVNGLALAAGELDSSLEQYTLNNLDELSAGIYFLKVGNDINGYDWQKLIKH